jgi:pyruvate/2-oxoglutarate dehydrogenase complex dihydrolipoamide acyltransferase (E2) component
MMTTTTTTSAATTTATTTTSAPTTSSRHPHRRLISSSPSPAAPVVDVTVASMGESISEGTVAAVLKAPGDAVAADEVIAQIETDKVTIDVRAPAAGKVTSLEVKEGESVVVGQVVAKVEEGAEGAVAAEKPAAVAPEKEEPAAVAPVAAVAPAAAPAAAAPSPPPPSSPRRQQQQQNQSPRRKPSISFPARLTRAGVRISSLSASDAREARAAIRAAELDEHELAERLSRGRRAGSNATIPLYVGTERGTKLSASRVLSDREMEMIELGGAAP